VLVHEITALSADHLLQARLPCIITLNCRADNGQVQPTEMSPPPLRERTGLATCCNTLGGAFSGIE